MEELENANPTMENSGENPVNPNGVEVENPATEQQSTDFSQLFSENIAEETPISEETPIKEEIIQEETPQQEEISSPAQPELQEVQSEVQPESQIPQPELQKTQPESSNTETATLVTEAIDTQTNVLNPEFTNNENDIQISEHAFDKQIENTSLDNHQNIQTEQVTAEQRKAAIEQQKLARLKQHTSKAKKSGFTSGILSGILLILLAFVACSVFAKDQLLNAIDYLGALIPINNTSTTINTSENISNLEEYPSDVEETEVIDDENEEVDEVQEYYDRINEILSSEDDQETKTEQLRDILSEVMQESEQPDDELIQYISQTIMDITINSEETHDNETTEIELYENEQMAEYSETEDENNEPINNEQEIFEDTDSEIIDSNEQEENAEPYTITYVNSEEEANWVLPAHCSDLTCYGDDQEFVECTSFRMIETLDENAIRVSSRGGCKYKDPSELVYVQFN